MIVQRLKEVFVDRRHRQRMAEASYWNDRAVTRTGHARSVWHAESFSAAWHDRQVSLLHETLTDLIGGLREKEVLDVGCGTGRVTFELDRLGARAVGVDFAQTVIEGARTEASERGASCRFEVGSITTPPLPFDDESFDAVVAVGCLAVACTDLASLETSLREMARLARRRGAVLLLEPAHQSALLGRVLKARPDAWIAVAQRAGLRLVVRSGMGFVPVRLALSSVDLPAWLVNPVFRAGENALDRLQGRSLADYSVLGFQRIDRYTA